MAERTTIRLPEELLQRAKRRAAAEGRTLTSLIEDGLRVILSNKDRSQKAKRVLPRISNATGGAMPGFGDDPFHAAQEMEDAEYAERLHRGFK